MKEKSFLVLLVPFTVGLIALSFWVISKNSVKPQQSFMMSNVSISIDFEDHQFLAGTISRFEYGTRQVCMRFDYSRLEADGDIQVIWDYGEKRVQAETYTLTAPSGTRTYCLLKEDGSPLPKGRYSVMIQYGSVAMPKFHFEIY